ncbi:MAG: right-handed parallel beta-helix repeat-containing protein [Usitatibacter sp.]
MSRFSPVVFLLAVAGAMSVLPAEAVQRVFVASYGSDANTATNCGFTNPCRGFTAAMTVVDPGGEVVALDAAGYGAVTITKSVTLTANPGFYAGIAASGGNAVTIATAAVKVTLRGLNINGVGALNGVSMTNGAGLSIENCVISNFSTDAVYVNATATVRIIDSLIRDNEFGIVLQGAATADIAHTKILGNASAGLLVFSQTASSTASATVTDSVLAKNNVNVHAFETVASALNRIVVIRSSITNGTYGLRSQFAGGPTVISVSESLVAGNSTGFSQEGAGSTLESLGNNTARFNGPDVGTVTSIALR